jgi:DNA polymerase-1
MAFILVDGSAYLFRAYHALPSLTNKKGFPTSAIFGVLNMLKKLKEEFAPEKILIVFDAKGKNFRHQLYPDYKANRLAMPEDLGIQIEPLLELIKLMGYPLYRHTGVEADDVIGTLAIRAKKHHEEVLIISSDKDLTQLLTVGINIFDPMKNIAIDQKYLQEKLGVLPEQIIDFLALTGDSSDNIPGLPGVGPKTAAKWLQQYQDLDTLLAHKDKITGKVGETLRQNTNQVLLAKELATIKCDLSFDDLPDLHMQPPEVNLLVERLREYDLHSLAKFYEGQTANADMSSPTKATHSTTYQLINTPTLLELFLNRIKNQPAWAVDTETTSLDPMQARIIGLSFSWGPNDTYFLLLEHQFTPTLDKTSTLAQLKPLFNNPKIKKIAQHAKYDWHTLKNEGIELQGLYFDTMIASYILNSAAERHDLASQAERELNRRGLDFVDLVGKGKNALPITAVPIDTLCTYACEDADFTWQLYEHYQKEFNKFPHLKKIFTDLEMPLVPILATMEHDGVFVDSTILKKLSHDWDLRLNEIMHATFKEVGSTFNLNSPKQLIHILFEKMHLPITQKTPKGEPSTNEAVLQELAPNYPIAKLLLEHRHLTKLKTTYTDKLALLINPQTQRIHTQYQQAVAVTGRLSSIEPNLQNIPMKTAEGRKIRSAFIAPTGCKIISADYSQIELRIMADLSQDPNLLDAFHHNKDIHRTTAAEVLGIAEQEVSAEQRRHAKAVNFGLIYGMSAFGLAKQLNINRKEAESYIQKYFERYPGVLRYMETTRAQAYDQGFVETLWGRRLYLPALKSKNVMERKGAERAAINAPLQGTAADIIKKAMIDFNHWLTQHTSMHARLIMQVHDELVVEVNEDHAAATAKALQESMEHACKLSVPLLAQVEISDRWE